MENCKTVLLVEDELEIRESLAELLADEGYDVLQARNGREALEQLRERAHLPCLIVLDLMMPVMDGYQFRAEQLRDEKLAHIPVVVVSADGQVKTKTASLKVASAMTKPLQLSRFVAEVERHCNKAA